MPILHISDDQGNYLEYNLEVLQRRLNEVCGTQSRLELCERQELRDMVELLADCARGGSHLQLLNP